MIVNVNVNFVKMCIVSEKKMINENLTLILLILWVIFSGIVWQVLNNE